MASILFPSHHLIYLSEPPAIACPDFDALVHFRRGWLHSERRVMTLSWSFTGDGVRHIHSEIEAGRWKVG